MARAKVSAAVDVDMDDADEYKPKPKAKGKGRAPAKKAKTKARSSDHEMEGDDVEGEEVKAKAKAKKGKGKKAAVAATGKNYVPPEESTLPPLSALAEIFPDMVGRLEDASKGELKDFVQHIGGRKLRVATMCSGTESPLLALRMITHAMKERWGLDFEIDHIFSCEIEPFKQAYIERNFRPRLLFRDVCELGGTQAYVYDMSVVRQ